MYDTMTLASPEQLESWSAAERVHWALENLPGQFILTSSFGIQSAVLLHLVKQIRPEMPVLFIDTGYLFPETYQFAKALTERLKLNLKVVAPAWTPARLESVYGKLWETGELRDLNKYHQIRKVEPLEKTLFCFLNYLPFLDQ